MNKESQNDMIFRHLMSGKQITPLDALSKFGCMRLASRINEIKDVLYSNPMYKGWRIVTHIVSHNGKRFASYELIKTELELVR